MTDNKKAARVHSVKIIKGWEAPNPIKKYAIAGGLTNSTALSPNVFVENIPDNLFILISYMKYGGQSGDSPLSSVSRFTACCKHALGNQIEERWVACFAGVTPQETQAQFTPACHVLLTFSASLASALSRFACGQQHLTKASSFIGTCLRQLSCSITWIRVMLR